MEELVHARTILVANAVKPSTSTFWTSKFDIITLFFSRFSAKIHKTLSDIHFNFLTGTMRTEKIKLTLTVDIANCRHAKIT